jgi:hypothetical protein
LGETAVRTSAGTGSGWGPLPSGIVGEIPEKGDTLPGSGFFDGDPLFQSPPGPPKIRGIQKKRYNKEIFAPDTGSVKFFHAVDPNPG